jgi:cysteine-rich repeat protein
MAGDEGCDDGNTAAGDGCSPACAVEPGFTCTGAPSACVTKCGDGIPAGKEACDDGNTAAGDGCSPLCAFEATCGNGLLEPGEACDDHNTTAGDGCGATCQLEAGTTCGASVDLNDPAKVTVAGAVTTYAGTTLGSLDTTFGASPSCSAGTTDVPRVLHRYRVGARPAVLQVDTEGSSALLDTVVWAYRDCQHPTPELACGEDGVTGLDGSLSTGYLPAGTTVFLVVSGYTSLDVGSYQLHVTETPATSVPASGTCAMPVPAGPGSWAGVTLAGDAHNGNAATACSADAPDAVYVVALAKTSDLVVSATSNAGAYDLVVSVLGGSCSGAEAACADARGAGSPESLVARDLAPGSYYVVVGGFGAADVGPYALAIDTVTVLPLGASCDPADATARCATGAVCHAGACAKPKDLVFADFTVALAPFAVTDQGADGQSWMYCDPASGCAWDNTTGASPADPFALIRDVPGVSLHAEILASPMLDAAGLTEVTLALDQTFEHAAGCADLGVVEFSGDAMTWTPVVSYTTDQQGHTVLDLSAQAAGLGAFYVRFRYDDQTQMSGDPFAKGWRVDNVHVYGF